MRRTGSATRLTQCPEVSQLKREISYPQYVMFHSPRLGAHRSRGLGHTFSNDLSFRANIQPVLTAPQNIANVLTLGLFKPGRHAPSPLASSTPATPMVQSTPPVDLSDVNDPGYQRASVLRAQAESLHILLTAGPDGRVDWNAIKSHQSGGCMDIKVRCDQVMKSLRVNTRHAGRATNTAHGLAYRGKNVSQCLSV